MRRLFNRENAFAVALCIIALLMIVLATDSAPQWIYQGF